MGKILRITARRDGFRRAGLAHPARPVDHPIETFTAEQVEALKAEPQLVVEEIDAGAVDILAASANGDGTYDGPRFLSLLSGLPEDEVRAIAEKVMADARNAMGAPPAVAAFRQTAAEIVQSLGVEDKAEPVSRAADQVGTFAPGPSDEAGLEHRSDAGHGTSGPSAEAPPATTGTPGPEASASAPKAGRGKGTKPSEVNRPSTGLQG